MILKKIILNNISSYEGYNEFDFSPQDDKNIILIGGKNGAGKTSLFNAIKLGLYGPLNYNYQTIHSQYLAKIKDIINKKAFTEKNVEAYVTISFDYINVREYTNYELTRAWRYVDQKIIETFTVKQDGILLDEAQLIYFDNFLQTILPPNLFSLFFFDGEELSNVFVGSKFNQYVKEAFMVLCNFDSFELIKKYSKNFIARNNNSDEAKRIENQLLNLIDALDTKRSALTNYKADKSNKINDLEKATTTKEELQKNFKEQGGLAEQEKIEIERQLKKHETNKATQSVVTKNFLEDLMPFIIVKDMAPGIKNQIIKEQAHDQQLNTLKYLSTNEVTESILSTLNRNNVQSNNIDVCELSKMIHETLLGDLDAKLNAKDFTALHNASLAGQNNLLSIAQKVEFFDERSILNAIDSKQASQKKTSALNEKLRNAMPEDVLRTYLTQLE
ncbi:MAG: AAA family ATPase, partial [Vagococcus sp.]